MTILFSYVVKERRYCDASAHRRIRQEMKTGPSFYSTAWVYFIPEALLYPFLLFSSETHGIY